MGAEQARLVISLTLTSTVYFLMPPHYLHFLFCRMTLSVVNRAERIFQPSFFPLLRYELWDIKSEQCVVRIPSNLHVCFLNRACSLIPPFLFCESTGDATREKCYKTNSCSQRCVRLCSGAFCLLAAHPLPFHLSVIPPHVLPFCSVYSFVAWYFFSMPTHNRGCN